MTNEHEPTLKHLAAELDQVIELLDVQEPGKQMLRDAALKTVAAAMQGGESQNKALMTKIVTAFFFIHKEAIGDEGCSAERLLAIARMAYRNACELCKLTPQYQVVSGMPGEPGNDKSGG